MMRDFGRAVLDPAADDTVFPLDTARRIGISLRNDTGTESAGVGSCILFVVATSNWC
jgi:hypothetical protein